MKKSLSSLLIGLMCMLCASCVTSSYAETSVCDEDVQIVIRYGTQYYYNNTLAYYIYDGYYFYPYRYNNAWRFHRYSRPLPPPRSHYGRPPHPHHNNGHRHFGNYNGHRHFGNYSHPQRNNGILRPSRPSHNHRPMRSSTRPHFGGRR